LLVCILLPIPTRADDAQNSALARSLFEEGVTASDAGDWPRALERFSRAYALRPSSGIAFNLATAEIEMKRTVRAAEHLRAVLNDTTTPAELRERARLRLAEVVPRIAYVTVHVDAAAADGVELRVDGVTLPTQAWGAATPVDPGQRVFDLVRENHIYDTRTITLQEGERTELTLKAEVTPFAEPAASLPIAAPTQNANVQPAPTATRASDRHTPASKRWIWWTSLGVAVAAGVTVGIVLATGDADSQPEAPVQGNTSEGVIRW
jgi:hypothetical protein